MPFGGAMIFVVTLVALAILGTYLLTYAAMCYLVVFQETSAGQDEVRWPDDPWLDRVTSGAWFSVLVFLALTPAGLLTRVIPDSMLLSAFSGRLEKFVFFAIPSLWLVFPVVLLSSLSATNKIAVLRPVIVVRLLQIFSQTIGFYLLSALIVSLALLPWLWVLKRSMWLGLIAGGISAACLLIHARLVGRLGWRMGEIAKAELRKEDGEEEQKPRNTRSEDRSQKRAEELSRKTRKQDGKKSQDTQSKTEAGSGKKRGTRPRAVEVRDIAVHLPTEPTSTALPETYGLAQEQPDPNNQGKPNSGSRWRSQLEETYDLSDSPPAPPVVKPKLPDLTNISKPGSTNDSSKQETEVERELRLRTRPEGYKPPILLLSNVFEFPWYSRNITIWMTLTLGFGLFGAGVSFALSLMSGIS